MRRVIELATPHLVEHWPGPSPGVVLAGGEAPDAGWLAAFRERLRGSSVTVLVRAAFGYASEWPETPAGFERAVGAAVRELLRAAGAGGGLIWAHNLGLGRNLHLARALGAQCHSTGTPLVAHHHDWWFENRWHHRVAACEPGFRRLDTLARTVFARSPHVAHAAINQADAAILTSHFPGRAGWLPNPVEPDFHVPLARARAARAWLRQQLGEAAPVWLVPCRLLRRKNLAEALLLTRWLRPEAWLVTTGGVTSTEERAYAERLAGAARTHGWRLRLSLLQGDPPDPPSVPELMAASEAILLTSLQEGFGLPYLEAAAARRPLLARALPNVAPDLATFGFRFPQAYREVLVDPALFDWAAERARQTELLRRWKRQLPRRARALVGTPSIRVSGAEPRPVPFSRLTLTAQLEVLARPSAESWACCARLNPGLPTWRTRAATGRLGISAWPRGAVRWLGGLAYARRFSQLIPSPGLPGSRARSGQAAQLDFLRLKLRSENLYPLLWDGCT